MRVEVPTVFATQMAKKGVLDIGDSGELTILEWAVAKEVAANEMEVHLKDHSILANTLRELKVLKHFLAEVSLVLPMG